MTIALSGTGGVFTRMGRAFGAIKNVNGFRGTAAPSPGSAWGASGPTINDLADNVNNIEAQYQSTRQDLIDSLYSQRNSYRSAHAAWLTYLQGLAQTTLVEMANDDTKLASKTIPPAMALLIAQMTTAAASVQKNTCAVTVTAAGANVGNDVMIASIIGANGVKMEYCFPETLTATVTTDRNGGATAGSEPFTVTSPVPETDPLMFDWPLGSGANAALTVVDPTIDNALSLLTNANAALFTGNVPNNWSVLVGTAGTTILDGGSTPAFNSQAHVLEFAGNGAEATSIAQTFNVSTGTLGKLAPSTVYAFNAYVKVSTTNVAGAGVLAFDLIDGNNAVINDAAAVANTISYTVHDVADTNYHAVSGFFRTPANLPATQKLRIRLSTALTNAINVFIANPAITPATQLYTGGPFAAIFRNTLDVIAAGTADNWALAVTNDAAGVIQTMMERVFGMRLLGMQVPSSGAPTVADSLVA